MKQPLITTCALGRLGTTNYLDIAIFVAILLTLFPRSVGAEPSNDNSPAHHVSQMSLEDLLTTQVFSASKKDQALFRVPSAVYVLTHEDIRRSGARSIPEVLRLVPGVNVARTDSSNWAVSIRGYNGAYGNKLLVLVDGRSVYTPVFGGVEWDSLDLNFEDIERIEVIRGPRASEWGSNAVNGVINIISKHSADTKGVQVNAGGGNYERGFGSVRYGDTLGEDGTYRAYAQYHNRGESETGAGVDGGDDIGLGSAGMRADWNLSDRDTLELSSQAYFGKSDQETAEAIYTPPFRQSFDIERELSGGHVLGRWRRRYSESSDLELNLYYDRLNKMRSPEGVGPVDRSIDTASGEIKFRFQPLDGHDLSLGSEYRFAHTQIEPSSTAHYDPLSRDINLNTVYLNDDITLIPDLLHIIVGSEFEKYEFVDFDYQPSARLVLTPNDKNTVWASVSRATRVPSVSERDLTYDAATFPLSTGGVGVSRLLGNRDLDSESIIGYEAGYRSQPLEELLVDLALYYNVFDHLAGLYPWEVGLDQTTSPPTLVSPLLWGNVGEGESYGGELALDWRLLDRLRLFGSYSYLNMDIDVNEVAFGQGTLLSPDPRNSPEHQAVMGATVIVAPSLELSLASRYVDGLSVQADRYIELDTRLAWSLRKNLEIALVGQNLLHDSHLEFVPSFIQAQSLEIPRSGYLQVRWNY